MKSLILKYFICLLFFSSFSSLSLASFHDVLSYDTYDLVSEKRLEGNIFEYEYQLTITNISGSKLKGVKAQFSAVSFPSAVLSANDQGGLFFGDLEIGQTQKSTNNLILRVDRSIGSVNLDNLSNIFPIFSRPIEFTDTKNNKIIIYPDVEPIASVPFVSSTTIHPTIDDLKILEQQNPTNIPNINNLPFITDQFIEITFSISSDKLPVSTLVNFEIKYSKNPYRLLLLKNNQIHWAIFTNHTDTNTVEFTVPIDSNNQITFALIEVY